MRFQSFLTNLIRSFAGLVTISCTAIFPTTAWGQGATSRIELAMNPSPCIQSLARSMGVTVWDIISEELSLEKKYCERMNLGFAQSAFAEGRDLPAEKLRTDWSPPENQITDVQIDSETLIQLNLQAKKTWDDLVNCHGSSEKARQAYLDLNNKCGLDKKIKEYSISVQSFLITNLPATKNSHINFSFHPLFTQVLLENANATSWMPGRDPISDSETSYINELLMNFFFEGYAVDDLYNPEKEQELKKRFYYLTVIKNTFPLRNFTVARSRQISSLKLLVINKAQDCESLGLWPGISRIVAKELVKDFKNSKIGSGELLKRYMKACGDFQYTNHAYSGRTRTSDLIVYSFRKLATRFSNKYLE